MFLLKTLILDHLLEITIGIVAACLLWFVYSAGENHIQGKWDREKIAQERELAELTLKFNNMKQQVVIQYITKIKEVQVKGKETIKYVNQIITKETNDRCVINDGAIRLLDAAAKASTFESRPDTDGKASGVELSTQISSVISNYTTCNQYRIQLNSLIDVIEGWEKVQ